MKKAAVVSAPRLLLFYPENTLNNLPSAAFFSVFYMSFYFLLESAQEKAYL